VDNVPVTAAFDVVIRIRDPLAFTANVLAGAAANVRADAAANVRVDASEFRVSNFLTRYEGELLNALAEAVGSLAWDSLKADQKT
jgi:hypothetical protein